MDPDRTGPTVEAATEDASRASVEFVAESTDLNPEEAFMLLSLGELRVGPLPRPVMAAGIMMPRQILNDAGFRGF